MATEADTAPLPLFDEDGITQVTAQYHDLTGTEMPPITMSIIYGVIAFIVGFVPLIVRFAANSTAVFDSGTYSIEIMWMVHVVLWGLEAIFWPFTYLKDHWHWALFYLRWYDIGINWAGVIVAFIITILLIVQAATGTSNLIAPAIIYPLAMGGIEFVTWWYIQPLKQYYNYKFNGVPEEEKEIPFEDRSPFVDFDGFLAVLNQVFEF